jgi:hypothetical protein
MEQFLKEKEMAQVNFGDTLRVILSKGTEYIKSVEFEFDEDNDLADEEAADRAYDLVNDFLATRREELENEASLAEEEPVALEEYDIREVVNYLVGRGYSVQR